jgi:hypothetical protein
MKSRFAVIDVVCAETFVYGPDFLHFGFLMMRFPSPVDDGERVTASRWAILDNRSAGSEQMARMADLAAGILGTDGG